MIQKYFFRGLAILATVAFFFTLGLFYGGVLKVEAGSFRWKTSPALGPLTPLPGSKVFQVRELYLNGQAGLALRCTTLTPLAKVLRHYQAKLSQVSIYQSSLFSKMPSVLGEWHQGVFYLKLGPMHMLATKDARGKTFVVLAYRESQKTVYYLFSGGEKHLLRPTPLPPLPFSSQVFSLEEKERALYGYTSSLSTPQAVKKFQKAFKQQHWTLRHKTSNFLLFEKGNQQCWLFFSPQPKGSEISVFLQPKQ